MTVTRKDYLCLRNEEFLNDVIIDFYLKYLQHGFFINDPDVQVQHLSYFSIWKLQGVFFSLVPPKISKRPDWSPPFPLKSFKYRKTAKEREGKGGTSLGTLTFWAGPVEIL